MLEMNTCMCEYYLDICIFNLLDNGFEGGTFNSRTAGNGATGERGVIGGVFISLVSSSRSVFEIGESFFFSSIFSVLSGIVSRLVGGNSFGLLSGGTSDGGPTTAAAEEDDDVDASIESGVITVVGGVGFCMSVNGNNFGLSRGINLSIIDEPTVAVDGGGIRVTSFIYA